MLATYTSLGRFMRSESFTDGQQEQGAGVLPLTVATIYLGMAAVATLVALLLSPPAAFLPLVLLSFPAGFLLLSTIDTTSLVLQALFVAAGIGINAWLAAMIAAAYRAARTRQRRR
jgi:hypothetical protein